MKKIYIINLFIGMIVSLISIPVTGQKSPHELSVYGGAGLGQLTIKTNSIMKDKGSGVGGLWGIGYTYYISQEFGLQIGLEYSLYSNKLSISALEGNYETMDNDLMNETFDFQYNINGYEETIKAGYIQTPIMAQYLRPFDSSKAFFLSAGIKIGFPVTQSFNNKLNTLSTKGYYADTNVEISEDSPDLGFGKYTNLKSKGDLELKTAFIASIETGMKWNFVERLSLYTGLYFDYGLNDINKRGRNNLIEYNQKSPDRPILNSASMSIKSGSGQLIEKLSLMSLGLKVKLAFDL